METRVLSVEIPKHLFDRLYQTAGKSKNPRESFAKQMESIVEIALTKHLDDLEGGQKVSP